MNRKRGAHVEVAPMHQLLAWAGPYALWLSERWILAFAVFAGGIVAILGALWFDPAESWVTPLRIAAGCLAALSVLLDKVADKFSKRRAELDLDESDREAQESVQAGERAAERALASVNVFIGEAIETTYLESAGKRDALVALRRTLVRCAADAIGEGTRATYYTLWRDDGGLRTLGEPEHHVIGDRKDKPDRPFEEKIDPAHDVWRIMDRADEEPTVRVDSEEIAGLDWTSKRYRTFYSVPVKARRVQFGFLSVNNAAPGTIGGAQSAALLAMARTMALVLSADAGPRQMKSEASRHAMSVAGGSVQNNSKEGAG